MHKTHTKMFTLADTENYTANVNGYLAARIHNIIIYYISV